VTVVVWCCWSRSTAHSFVLGLRLAEPVLLDVVEHLRELLGIEFDRRVEVLGDQCRDVLVDDLRLPAFGVGNESSPVVDPVDDAHRRLEDSVRVGGDRDHRAERHRRMWFWEFSGPMLTMSWNASSTGASTSAAGS